MRQDLTHITLVIDRSGSMCDIRDDAQGGVNAFLDAQRALPGAATVTVVQFDDQYEKPVDARPIAEVGAYRLEPRGGTALLDAVGRAVAETADYIARFSDADRPALVGFVIVTDGKENASREWTAERVRALVAEKSAKDHWKFTYLGANVDAFAEAGKLGIPAAAATPYHASNSAGAYGVAHSNFRRMRSAAMSGVDAGEIECAYTDEEVKLASAPKVEETP